MLFDFFERGRQLRYM